MKEQQYQHPILPEELEGKIEDAIQAFLHRDTWKEWGLDKLRQQGAAILLHGAPGLGKTLTAYYIAKKLHLAITEISMADYGSDKPGQLARNIRKIFSGEVSLAKMKHKNPSIIFLDECDSMLISRKKLGADMVWMLEPITALMVEIARYPGLVILATNLVTVLDEALERRLLARIRFEKPDSRLRRKIWQAKWPKKFPSQPNEQELDELAEYDLTGAQIENAFMLWSGRCIKFYTSNKSYRPEVVELILFLENKWGDYYQL